MGRVGPALRCSPLTVCDLSPLNNSLETGQPCGPTGERQEARIQGCLKGGESRGFLPGRQWLLPVGRHRRKGGGQYLDLPVSGLLFV